MSPPQRPKVNGRASAPRRRRAEWGSLSREQVIDAAVAVVREGRYDEMTIRSLASELGVAPMALYRHIRDKDDLLDEVTDRLLASSWRAKKDSEDWCAWTLDSCKRFRQLLVSQPAVLHVYLTHPVASPAALERMNAAVQVLRDAGLSREAAQRTYAALHTYTVGFSALEASRSRWQATTDTSDAIVRQLASFTTTKQFVIGLEMLLSAVADAR